MLTSETIKNTSGTKVQEVIYSPTKATGTTTVKGLLISLGATPYTLSNAMFVNPFYYDVRSEFWYNPTVTTRLYDGTNYIETVKKQKFTSLSSGYFQISEVLETAPHATLQTGGYDWWYRTTYQYSYNFSDAPMLALTNQNRLTEIINTAQDLVQESNGSVINVQPLQASKLVYNLFGGVYQPSQLQQKYESGNWQTELDYLAYSSGNLTQYRDKTGANHYLSYYGTGDLGKTNLLKAKEIDDGTNNATLKSLQKQTVDYSPLQGVKTITSPNSLSANYEYDGLGRLVRIKNASSNITDRFTYQYRNSSGCSTPQAPSISISSSTICNTTITASGCSGTVVWNNGQNGNSITVSNQNSIPYYAYCSNLGCNSANSTTITTPLLPSGWATNDIGTPIAGCTNNVSGNLSLLGNGSVSGTNDSFHWIYKQLSGDFTMIAKINSIGAVDGNRCGIMIRSNLNANAQFYTLIQDGNANVGELKRDTDGAAGGLYSFAASPLNQTWIKVVKTGNTIKGYYSTNTNPEANNAWNGNFNLTGTNPTTMSFGSSFYIGLVAWGNANQVSFSNITINGQSF
jgi:hypothetical protein